MEINCAKMGAVYIQCHKNLSLSVYNIDARNCNRKASGGRYRKMAKKFHKTISCLFL